MINEELTKERFGYYSTDLKPRSGKKIVVTCEKCCKNREIYRYDYHALCGSCAQKGGTLSEEHKRKISISKKGINHPLFGKHRSEETKRKISEAHKGMSSTEEAVRKMTGKNNPNYGKHPSEETIKKLSGKNNHNWKNGTSFEPYCQRFNFTLKEKIREKYGRKCYLCGKSEEENGQRLSVHHIDNEKMQGCEDKSWFLLPLCRPCHMQLHANERKKKKEKTDNKVLYLQESLL